MSILCVCVTWDRTRLFREEGEVIANCSVTIPPYLMCPQKLVNQKKAKDNIKLLVSVCGGGGFPIANVSNMREGGN